MEGKEQIKNDLKNMFGVELTPTSDFTKLPDEILANAHLYDWYDKVSIQANVEMSRRLKVAVQSLEKTIINLDRSFVASANKELHEKIIRELRLRGV